MAQDILMRKGRQTELDSINGRIIELANRHNLPSPFNRTIYDLCQREFSKPDFQPLDLKTIWAEVQKRM